MSDPDDYPQREACQRLTRHVSKLPAIIAQEEQAAERSEFIIRECGAVENLLRQIRDTTEDARSKEEVERALWSVQLIRQRAQSENHRGIAEGLGRALAILAGEEDA